MARYEQDQLDRCASDALELCERVRQTDPERTYVFLARQCVRDPERMAQLLMTLATFVDPNKARTGELRRVIAAASAEQRITPEVGTR